MTEIIPGTPDVNHLVEQDWLPVGQVTMLSGPKGIGKSWIALRVATKVAMHDGPVIKTRFSNGDIGDSDKELATLEWTASYFNVGLTSTVLYRQRYKHPGWPELVDNIPNFPVLFFSYGESEDEILSRLQSIVHFPNDFELRSPPSLLAPRNQGPLWDQGGITGTGRNLIGAASHLRAKLLVINSTKDAYAGDESGGDVRRFLCFWDKWAQENKCAVLMVRHIYGRAFSEMNEKDVDWLWNLPRGHFWWLEKATVPQYPEATHRLFIAKHHVSRPPIFFKRGEGGPLEPLKTDLDPREARILLDEIIKNHPD